MFAAAAVRPDLQLACSKLARRNAAVRKEHLREVQQSLSYFVNTPTIGIQYSKQSEDSQNILKASCDANWKKTGDAQSQSGYLIWLNGGPISWGSKKQSTPCLSSCESELVAAVSTTQEIITLRRQLSQLGLPQSAPTEILTDNMGLIYLMENNRGYAQAKGIHRLYWLRQQVNNKIVRLSFIPGADNPADFLTKPLRGQRFLKCREGAKLIETAKLTEETKEQQMF
jgi:hypothetical protein